MSSIDLVKQYYQVFSRIGKTYDEKNDFIKQDRFQLLLELPKSSPKVHKRFSKKSKIDSKTKKSSQAKGPGSATFRVQGREDYYKSNGKKPNGPIYGFYNSNYDSLTKKIPVPDFTLRPKSQSKVKTSPTDIQLRVVDKPQPKIKLPIGFNKQLPRVFSYHELNENRFAFINDKMLCNRISTPNLSHGKGHNFDIKECSNSSFYLSKLNGMGNNLIKRVPDFSRYTSRKPLLVESMNDVNYECISYSLTEKSTPVYSIKKKKDPQRLLPEYMKNTGKRMELNTITDFSLKQNYFSTVNSFSPANSTSTNFKIFEPVN